MKRLNIAICIGKLGGGQILDGCIRISLDAKISGIKQQIRQRPDSGAYRWSLILNTEFNHERMKPGDFVNIPAHRGHRVEWTAPDEPTVCLAVHYGGSDKAVKR